jgi:hypothetical protein
MTSTAAVRRFQSRQREGKLLLPRVVDYRPLPSFGLLSMTSTVPAARRISSAVMRRRSRAKP